MSDLKVRPPEEKGGGLEEIPRRIGWVAHTQSLSRRWAVNYATIGEVTLRRCLSVFTCFQFAELHLRRDGGAAFTHDVVQDYKFSF